jgi:hypothetical protein
MPRDPAWPARGKRRLQKGWHRRHFTAAFRKRRSAMLAPSVTGRLTGRRARIGAFGHADADARTTRHCAMRFLPGKTSPGAQNCGLRPVKPPPCRM